MKTCASIQQIGALKQSGQWPIPLGAPKSRSNNSFTFSSLHVEDAWGRQSWRQAGLRAGLSVSRIIVAAGGSADRDRGEGSLLRPSHTTVRTDPYTAVRMVKLSTLDQGRKAKRGESCI